MAKEKHTQQASKKKTCRDQRCKPALFFFYLRGQGDARQKKRGLPGGKPRSVVDSDDFHLLDGDSLLITGIADMLGVGAE